MNAASQGRAGSRRSRETSGRGLGGLAAVVPEAACGAEREVEIVKGSEALEGCPTTPAASGQEEDRWLNRYPRNSPIQGLPIPLAISGLALEGSQNISSPPNGLSEYAAAFSLLAHPQPSHRACPCTYGALRSTEPGVRRVGTPSWAASRRSAARAL